MSQILKAYKLTLHYNGSPSLVNFASTLEQYANVIESSNLWKHITSTSQEGDNVIVELSSGDGILARLLSDKVLSNSHELFKLVQRFLALLYIQISKAALEAGKPLIDIQLRFNGISEPVSNSEPYEMDFSHIKEKSFTMEIKENNLMSLQGFKYVAMGGTFDHLHNGHKILLTIACLVTSYSLLCGVTDGALLINKKNSNILESLEVRCGNVKKFLKNIKPSLNYEVVPIIDPAGPTAYRPEFEALVVSEETRSSGIKLNEIRHEKGFNNMRILSVDVIGPHGILGKEGWENLKLSSTAIREILLKRNKTS